jgi:transcriptional regulator with XRE-family HTH domain
MSFREMQDVREVLRRRQAGLSARQIARETGLDRKTVGRYLEQANEHGLELEAAVTDEIAGAVGKEVQARPLPTPSEAWQALIGRRAQIEAWLDGEPPLKLVRVHELLAPRAWRSATRRCVGSRVESSAGASKHRRCDSTIRRPGRRRGSTSG